MVSYLKEIIKSKINSCAKCDKEVMENSVICTKCGKSVRGRCMKMKIVTLTLANGFVC